MASGQYKDVEQGKINSLEDLETPLIHEDKIVSYKTDDDGTDHETRSIGMVLLSTFVAVCGSFGFGSCVSSLNSFSLPSFTPFFFLWFFKSP